MEGLITNSAVRAEAYRAIGLLYSLLLGYNTHVYTYYPALTCWVRTNDPIPESKCGMSTESTLSDDDVQLCIRFCTWRCVSLIAEDSICVFENRILVTDRKHLRTRINLIRKTMYNS